MVPFRAFNLSASFLQEYNGNFFDFKLKYEASVSALCGKRKN